MSHITFSSPSTHWLERLPLGNGRLGAMVGVSGGETRIGLNESSAWSGGLGSAERDAVDPADAAAALSSARAALAAGDPAAAEIAMQTLQHRYSQAFLPVGELRVTVGETASETPRAAGSDIAPSGGTAPSGERITRRLDLRNGTHVSTWSGVHGETACLVEPDVLVHAVRSAEPRDVVVALSTPLRVRDAAASGTGARWVLDLPADVAPGHEPGEPAVIWDLPGIAPRTLAVALEIRHDGELLAGTAADGDAVPDAAGDGIRISAATRVDVFLAIESTASSAATSTATGTATAIGAAPAPRAEAVARAADRLAGTLDADAVLAVHRDRHRKGADAFALTLGPAAAESGESAATDEPSEVREPAARVAALPQPGAAASDPALLALLVSYGRYLLRASSRAGGVPANLQGIWNDDMRPPWSSNFTLNINTPMNYWGAEATQSDDAHRALLELLSGLARRGSDTAMRLYGARGWVAHHNSDAWGYSLPTRGDASWSQWALGGAWLVRQFDEHRRHGSMTPETRERYLPIVAGCARFLLDLLVEDGAELVTVPSTSPENRYLTGAGPASLTRSSAMDRALIRDVLAIAVDVLAGVDDELVAEAEAARRRIPGPRPTADGRIAEWDGDPADEDPAHRHLSHLFSWFPGAEGAGAWGEGTDVVMADAVARTLDARGDDSTGWSLAWKIALRARLRDAAAVGRLLDLVVRPAADGAELRGGLYPNLLAAHPPFQIDGNLGLVGAVLECIVQSHRQGRIDLLPAVPAALADGRLRGAIVRPGLRLDLDWADGRPVRVALRARTAAQAGTYRVGFGEASVTVAVTAARDTVLVGAGLDPGPGPVASPGAGRSAASDSTSPIPDRSIP